MMQQRCQAEKNNESMLVLPQYKSNPDSLFSSTPTERLERTAIVVPRWTRTLMRTHKTQNALLDFRSLREAAAGPEALGGIEKPNARQKRCTVVLGVFQRTIGNVSL